MIPNYITEVQQCRLDHPQAWRDAHTGNSHTEDFIRLCAARIHAMDPKIGLNGKRGDPNDISDDALNYLGEGAGTTPGGQPCSVIDVIGAAGSPSAHVTWQVFTDPASASGAWVLPGPSPVPPTPVPPVPVPPVYPPYPGDVTFDQLGSILFADYARAGQAPNPQMGRWFGRTIHDHFAGMSMGDSIAKHRAEWLAILGLPPGDTP